MKQIVCDFFMMGTHTQGNGYFCHTYKVEKKQWDKQYCPAKNNATNGGQIAIQILYGNIPFEFVLHVIVIHV